MRGGWLCAMAVAASLLAGAAPAAAHTHLEDLRPEPEATLPHPPRQVELDFNQPVELAGDAVGLRSGGRDVPLRVSRQRAGATLVLRPRTGLRAGRVDVRFRVLSRDGHVLKGRFGFQVRRGAVAGPASGEALRVSDGGGGAHTAIVVVHGLHHLLFVLVAGLVLAGPLVLPAAGLAWPGGLLRALCLGAALAAVLCASLTWLVAADRPWARAVLPGTISDAAGTTAGGEWLLRAGLWTLAAFAAAGVARATGRWVLGGVVAAVALSLALSGHPASHGGAGSVAVDAAHLLAAGAWLGGVAVLAGAVRRGGDRAAATRGFTRVAWVAFAVLVASGAANAVLRLGALHEAVDTAYGRLVLVKAGLAVAIAAVVALTARRRALAGVAGAQLGVELALGASALAIAAVLVETAPPS